MDTLLSKTISLLRFPLILCIVLIHSVGEGITNNGINIIDSSGMIFKIVTTLISGIFAHTAVPIFFVIAGFLLFFKYESFFLSNYISTIKKRFFTLFIPYVFWNLFVIIVYFAVESFAPSFVSGKYPKVVDWSFEEWFLAFWNFDSTGFPKCGWFWFIRDLIVITLVFPIIFFIIKYTSILLPIVLCILYILLNDDLCVIMEKIIGFNFQVKNSSLFFICLGAYLGINKINIIKWCSNKSITIYLILSLVELSLTLNKVDIQLLHRVNILFGIFAIFSIAKLLAQRGYQLNKIVNNSTFFVYASHGIILIIIQKLLAKLFVINGDISSLIWYLSSSIMTIFSCIISYYLSLQLSPKFTSIICGGRV